MRIAFASLILAASLAGAAHAQDVVVAAPPAPVLPTTGDGAAVLSVLDRICLPAVRGQSLDEVAKAAGMKQNRRDLSWAMPLGGNKAYQVIVQSQGSNKNSCVAEVRFALGQEEPIVTAIGLWAFLRQPSLEPTANYVQAVDPDGLKRVRKSWESVTSSASTAVNFSTVRKTDDSSLNRNYDTGMLFYQERTF